jgi:hypothetical protein
LEASKKTTKNRSVIFSAASSKTTENSPVIFLVVSVKITAGDKIIFSGYVVAAESFAIFTSLAKPPKVTLIFSELFLVTKYHRK